MIPAMDSNIGEALQWTMMKDGVKGCTEVQEDGKSNINHTEEITGIC